MLEVAKPYEFIGFGAMDVTKPYKFIGFGAICIRSHMYKMASYEDKEICGLGPDPGGSGLSSW